MTDKTYRTKSGKTLTEADIDTLADEVTITDYDAETLEESPPRSSAARLCSRRGRPSSTRS